MAVVPSSCLLKTSVTLPTAVVDALPVMAKDVCPLDTVPTEQEDALPDIATLMTAPTEPTDAVDAFPVMPTKPIP